MPGLNRSLGIPMLTFYGTGMILGAGVYSVIGKAAGQTGEALWLGFLLAGIAAMLTAFSYAELSTMFPKAGAEFVYLSHAFKTKKWLAISAGVAMAFSGAATAATVALSFSGYLNQFFENPSQVTAAVLLLVFTGVAILGIRNSGWTNVVFTLIEMSGLGLIIYLGLQSEKFGDALAAGPTMGAVSGAALIIFSYFGFENIVNLSEETIQPEKKLPWAIFLSLGISTALYLLVSLAAIALMSPEALSKSNAALMSVAQTSSAKMASILGAIALFSTANTALISMVGASRILYGMSESKALPRILSQTLSKRKTPWIASIVILAVALVLIPIGKIEIVAGVSSVTTMIIFISVNAALIALRYSDQNRKRPFRVPLHIGKLPILPTLGALLSFVFLFQFNATVYAVSGGLISVCLLGSFFYTRFSRSS